MAIERQIFDTQLALEVEIAFKCSFVISNTVELDVLESITLDKYEDMLCNYDRMIYVMLTCVQTNRTQVYGHRSSHIFLTPFLPSSTSALSVMSLGLHVNACI